MPNGELLLIGSPRASQTLIESGTRASSSESSRDLPAPGGAVTTTARVTGSAAHSDSVESSSDSSRSRPTNGVGFPSSVRATSSPARMATEDRAVRVLRQDRAAPEERLRHLVDADPGGAAAFAAEPLAFANEARRALERLAHPLPAGHFAAAGSEADGRPSQLGGEA